MTWPEHTATRQRATGHAAPNIQLACSIAALAALAACAFMLQGTRDFCLDDAWIHLTYARNLRLGHGFSYNLGDHETGFSSPLWVAMLALLPLGDDPVLPVKCLGALLHAALAWGCTRLVYETLRTQALDWRPLACGVWVALDASLVFGATSGMEVSLAACLLVWTSYCSLRRRWRLSFLLAACAVLARPECLFFIGAFAGQRAVATRSRAELWPIIGGLTALALWIVYCLSVSGHPWPNTYYAKGHGDLLTGLRYIGAEVLPAQSWVLSIAGILLVAASFARAGDARRLTLAWLVTMLTIAATRELAIGVTFYYSRYFSIVAAMPLMAAVIVLPHSRYVRVVTFTCALCATLYLLQKAPQLQHAQEASIEKQHTLPARWLAQRLPAGSRIAVEGAGAARYFIPADSRVLDVVGLNHAGVVHAKTPLEGLCVILREHPTYVLLPDELIASYQWALRLELLHTFVDERYAIGATPGAHRVYAARVVGLQPVVYRACSGL